MKDKQIKQENITQLIMSEDKLSIAGTITAIEKIEELYLSEKQNPEESLLLINVVKNFLDLNLESIATRYFYSESNLLLHELSNSLALPISYIDYINAGYSVTELGQENDNYINSCLTASKNFLVLLQKTIGNPTDNFSFQDFVSTFPNDTNNPTSLLAHQEINKGLQKITLTSEGKNFDFNSFSEFLSIRTLVLNTLKTKGVDTVSISKYQDKFINTVYTISDNGENLDEFRRNIIDRREEFYASGVLERGRSLSSARHGSEIAISLAGQRGDFVDTTIDRYGRKSISIGFGNK